MVWKPEFSVGVALMDVQHKKVFTIINELQDAVEQRRASSVVAHALDEMTAYTQYHLREEERLLEQHGYPTLPEHRLKHEILTKRLLLFKKSYDEGQTAIVPVSLLSFLQEWWTRHILQIDMQYRDFFNQKGVR